VIVRLDGTGNVVQTYSEPNEPNFWAGLALVGDGTFWAVSYYSSSVYRFNLATGALLSSVNTGTPNYAVVAVAVSSVTGGSCPK
jgi:outer membrane protein assembly factor BamB